MKFIPYFKYEAAPYELDKAKRVLALLGLLPQAWEIYTTSHEHVRERMVVHDIIKRLIFFGDLRPKQILLLNRMVSMIVANQTDSPTNHSGRFLQGAERQTVIDNLKERGVI